MTANLKYYHILFFLLFTASIFFRFKIAFELPLGVSTNEYGLKGFDDEPAHLNYTMFIIQNNTLPKFTTDVTSPDAFQKNEFEYHQPPLYYLLIFSLSKLFAVDSLNQVLLIGRVTNILLSLLGMVLVYLILKKLYFSDIKILTALSIYLLLGSSVYQQTVFSNDTLSWIFIWSLLFLVLDSVFQNWQKIVIILTLAQLTKLNIFPFYFLLLAVFYLELKNQKILKLTVIRLTAILLVPFILLTPWYLRNLNEYGSIFLLNLFDYEWHFVKSIGESILKLLRMPYSFLFRMHFEPTKEILTYLNILPNIWLLSSAILTLVKMRQIFKATSQLQTINLLLMVYSVAYLYYAIPTGYTEGRFLYPALPAILYFMTEILFIEKIKNRFVEGWQMLFTAIVFLPSFIFGFF